MNSMLAASRVFWISNGVDALLGGTPWLCSRRIRVRRLAIRASHPRENDQTFRHAALSRGLDIVRKALGARRSRPSRRQ